MDLSRSPYLAALDAECLVADIASPASIGELAALLRAAPSLVVGSGNSGANRPAEPVVVISLATLGGHAKADRRSASVAVPAWWTWEQAEVAARDDGLTFGALIDAYSSRTVGATLAMPALLPALWMSNTVRSACVGLEAVSADGAHYRHIVSPRTASGPDLRAVFLGAEGQRGAIVNATLRAERAGPLRWFTGELREELQPLLNEFGSVLSVRGADGVVALRVRAGTRFAGCLADQLANLGYRESNAPLSDRPSAIGLSLPWDRLALVPDGMAVVAAGPTHVAFGGGVDTRDAARDAAMEAPMGRFFRYGPEAFG